MVQKYRIFYPKSFRNYGAVCCIFLKYGSFYTNSGVYAEFYVTYITITFIHVQTCSMCYFNVNAIVFIRVG